jgi:hypothetical protein
LGEFLACSAAARHFLIPGLSSEDEDAADVPTILFPSFRSSFRWLPGSTDALLMIFRSARGAKGASAFDMVAARDALA